MCGIFGEISFKSSLTDNSRLLIESLNTLNHRGPDESNFWFDESQRIFFGHKRLAIIDLSKSGSQPMIDNNQNAIIFNGEIYNFKELKNILIQKGYTFKSQSDTEVLLKAYDEYGESFVSKLNGMFAFALYDYKKKIILFARDRAGEKPFFYFFNNDGFVFASELKAILYNKKNLKKLDHLSLDLFLSYGYVPGKRSIIEGINKLPPGHILSLDILKKDIKLIKYWDLPDYEASLDNFEDLQNKLEFLLEDAVAKQMIADVPIGILLSGGIDSSLITAMAVRSKPNVQTFNIRFPGYNKFDETYHARLIAKYFGTKHIELEASKVDPNLMHNLAIQFDEPIADSSMIPTFIVSKLIKQYCTVALGGDGGDELFGGYNHYTKFIQLQRQLKWVNYKIRKPFFNLLSSQMPVGFKGKNWIHGFGGNLETSLPNIPPFFDKKSRMNLISKNECAKNGLAEKYFVKRIPDSKDILQRATRMDFKNYLPENILVKVDRASMLNSLELRAPFLDFRIIDFAFSKVPSSFKASNNYKKIILKNICKKILPPEFDTRRKQGFSIPLSSWLNEGEWLDYFKSILLSSSENFFNRKYIEKLFINQQNGYSNSERLFSLVLFELWRKQYDISF